MFKRFICISCSSVVLGTSCEVYHRFTGDLWHTSPTRAYFTRSCQPLQLFCNNYIPFCALHICYVIFMQHDLFNLPNSAGTKLESISDMGHKKKQTAVDEKYTGGQLGADTNQVLQDGRPRIYTRILVLGRIAIKEGRRSSIFPWVRTGWTSCSQLAGESMNVCTANGWELKLLYWTRYYVVKLKPLSETSDKIWP